MFTCNDRSDLDCLMGSALVSELKQTDRAIPNLHRDVNILFGLDQTVLLSTYEQEDQYIFSVPE